jgi:hypothetical protein
LYIAKVVKRTSATAQRETRDFFDAENFLNVITCDQLTLDLAIHDEEECGTFGKFRIGARNFLMSPFATTNFHDARNAGQRFIRGTVKLCN